MLDCDHQLLISELIGKLECRVQLPEKLSTDFFDGQGELHDGFDERRRFVRRKCRTHGILEISQSLPQILRDAGTHSVILSDISRGGFGFFHFQELFPEERVKLWLPTQPFQLRVARCTRFGDLCYLVGGYVESTSDQGES